MRGFRFRLESILRLRSSELDVRRAELQREISDRERAVAEAASSERQARAAGVELLESLAAGAAGDELRAGAAAQDRLQAESRRARGDAEALDERAEAARSELVEAWKRLRTLEIVRKRAVDVWRREWERREQRSADELAARAGGRTR